MHQRYRTDRFLVLQIQKVVRHLLRIQLPLVVDRFIGAGNDIQPLRTNTLNSFTGYSLRIFSKYKQFSIKCFRTHLLRLCDKNLLNTWLRLRRIPSQILIVHRHHPIPQQRQPKLLQMALNDLFACRLLLLITRKKGHSYAIFTCRRQFNTYFRTYLSKKGVWNLQQNARTISAFHIKSGSTTVFHACQHTQCICNNGVLLRALQIRNKTNTAAAMLKISAI